MEDPERFALLGVILCLLILAFTSAVDAAFTAINRHRLNTLMNEGGSRARAVAALMSDPYRFKSTVLFLNIFATIAATALIFELTDSWAIWQQVFAILGLIFAMLLVSEVIPKALAIRNPAAIATHLAGPLNTVTILLSPIMFLVDRLTAPIFYLISGKSLKGSPLVTEEELRLMMNVSEEEGVIEHEEREMIEGVFSFGDTLLREIMVPRVDFVAVEQSDSLDEALELVISQGHSRIPVYDESLDRIVGILYAKDLLPILRQGKTGQSIVSLMRRPYFVPETIRVDALLKDLRQRKVHIAIAVDEYGGVSGLATIEDLIEQIVGEIQDEYDTEEPPIVQISEGVYDIDAAVSIDDINDLMDISLEADDSDRIGGLVQEHLKRVPDVGDKIDLGDALITVLDVKGVRLQKVRIARQSETNPALSAAMKRGDAHGPA